MTVSTTVSKNAATGNGVTTLFAFPYPFIAATDLQVYVNGVLKTLTTDYTISGSAPYPSGANVTFLVAPANGTSIVIKRVRPFTQTLDLVENDPLPAEPVEQDFDHLVMLAQQLSEALSRVPQLGTASLFSNITIDDPVAGALVGWNVSATGLTNYFAASTALTPVSPYMATVLTQTSAALARAALGSTTIGDALFITASAAAARTTLGLGTAAVANTGVSGHNLPFLDGANAWSAGQQFNAGAVVSTTNTVPLQISNANGAGTAVYAQFLANAASLGFIGASTGYALSMLDNLGAAQRFGVDSTGQGLFNNGVAFGNGANANGTVLDWYEEGTFTPTYVGGTTAGTTTYTSRGGVFIRIGKMVVFFINIITSAGTGTGQPTVGGLPYSSVGTFFPCSFYNNGLAGTSGNVQQPIVLGGSSNIAINQYVQTTGAQVAGTFDGTVEMYLTGMYPCA